MRAVARRLLPAVMFACLLLAVPAQAAELTERGAAMVLGFIAETGAIGDDRTLSEAAQRTRLQAVLALRFDMPRVARFVLGRHWSSATPAQVGEFTTLLEGMIVKVYGARFTGRSHDASAHTSEQFRIVSSQAEGDQAVLVRSQAARSAAATPTRIDWRLSASDAGEPKIVDVIVEGVSLRLSYQEDFGATIQRSGRGIDGLLEQLRAKLGS